ncbi:MAG: hypothetical protein HC890_07250 [Chloroflexaceae bacterium]|nr:hypothetical protein [Chloroflexaceae bacterium]
MTFSYDRALQEPDSLADLISWGRFDPEDLPPEPTDEEIAAKEAQRERDKQRMEEANSPEGLRISREAWEAYEALPDEEKF